MDHGPFPRTPKGLVNSFTFLAGDVQFLRLAKTLSTHLGSCPSWQHDKHIPYEHMNICITLKAQSTEYPFSSSWLWCYLQRRRVDATHHDLRFTRRPGVSRREAGRGGLSSFNAILIRYQCTTKIVAQLPDRLQPARGSPLECDKSVVVFLPGQRKYRLLHLSTEAS